MGKSLGRKNCKLQSSCLCVHARISKNLKNIYIYIYIKSSQW